MHSLSSDTGKIRKIYAVYHLRDAQALNSIPQAWLQACEVVVTNSGVGIDAKTLSNLPAIKLVANFGTG